MPHRSPLQFYFSIIKYDVPEIPLYFVALGVTNISANNTDFLARLELSHWTNPGPLNSFLLKSNYYAFP